MNISWEAKKYTNDFSFVHQYGRDVLDLLDLKEGMTLLDLGCGNGALTDRLCEMGIHAFGIDASADQVAEAKSLFPHLEFRQADATCFELAEPVDAVFSNAVLHWIDKEKQPDVLKCVYHALKPGGQFVFEMGGAGNTMQIHQALAEQFAARGLDYTMPFYFPSIGEYGTIIEAAGFRLTHCMLFDRFTPLKGEDGLYDWIKMFVKAPFLNLSDRGSLAEEIIRDAVVSLRDELYRGGVWYADYVRLRCKAIR